MDGRQVTMIKVPGFDLALTLSSGQFFRYRRDGEAFVATTRDRVLRLAQRGDEIEATGADEAFVRRFLGLDADHPAALAGLARDPRMAPLVERCRGLRLMRQDPWECLVGFACSAASNIPRISKNVEDIARRFGRPIGKGIHAFPGPGPLPAGALRPVKLGFRERRVEALFALVTDAWLDSLRKENFEDARLALTSLPGVGVKVAECVMLFSLGFGEAFPVDVWIRRAARRLFFRGRRVTDRAIAASMRRRFAANAGLAQQMLYVAAREA